MIKNSEKRPELREKDLVELAREGIMRERLEKLKRLGGLSSKRESILVLE